MNISRLRIVEVTRFLVSLLAGLSVGAAASGFLLHQDANPALAAEQDPFRLMPGLNYGCDGWRYDSTPWTSRGPFY